MTGQKSEVGAILSCSLILSSFIPAVSFLGLLPTRNLTPYLLCDIKILSDLVLSESRLNNNKHGQHIETIPTPITKTIKQTITKTWSPNKDNTNTKNNKTNNNINMATTQRQYQYQ